MIRDGNQSSGEETADGALRRKNLDDAPKEKPTTQNENINIDTQNESIIIIKGLDDDTYQPPLFSL